MAMKKTDFTPIIKYLKPYKKAIQTAAFFAVLENLFFLALPIIYGKVVDNVIRKHLFGSDIILLLTFWVIINLLGDWFGRIKSRQAAKIAFRCSADVMQKSLQHLVILPLSFHKNKKIGEIIQRFSRADSHMYDLIDRGIFSVIPSGSFARQSPTIFLVLAAISSKFSPARFLTERETTSVLFSRACVIRSSNE